MPDVLRIAYTLEQLWHDVPGGTAVAALRVAEQLDGRDDVELHAVAGRHRRPPARGFTSALRVASLPLNRPWLYETWLRMSWPRVEAATGPIDVCHSTTIVVAASTAPAVVTLHDLAFLRHPERFTKRGVSVMNRSLAMVKERADLVLCSSSATMTDAVDAGIEESRLRRVPLGVELVETTEAEVDAVRRQYDLPERFVLSVGTNEPRKNLQRLAEAMKQFGDLDLVIVGPEGWGAGLPSPDTAGPAGNAGRVRFLGFVPNDVMGPLFRAATVFAYPSEWEGFGLPVAEAMAQGTIVVTSRGTATEEVAGGAAILVDPFSVDDIGRGLGDALQADHDLGDRGRARAAELTWDRTAQLTVDAYREVAP